MTLSRDRLVLGAIVLSETAWLFGIFGVIGAMAGHDGSPLDWLALVVIMFLAIAIGRIQIKPGPTENLIVAAELAFAVAVIYLVVGAQIRPGASGVDLLWVFRLTSGAEPEGFGFRGVAGALFAVTVWLRGASYAAAEFPVEKLMLSFRLGLLALGVSITFDIVHPAELDTFPMVFIFFAAGLGGLSIGHLAPESDESSQAGLWPRVIAGMVASILVLGLIVGLLRRGALSYFSDSALSGLEALTKAVFWAVIIPFAFVYGLFISFLNWVLSPLQDRIELEEELATSTTQILELPELDDQAAGSFELVDLILQFLEASVIFAVVALLLLVLVRGFTGMLRGRRPRTRGERESVREDADPMSDMGKLLAGLIPSWFGRNKGPTFSLPDGPPGVVDAMRVYYELLEKAKEQGIHRPQPETPSEHRPILQGLYPGDLVPASTEAFNRACYGHHPASAEQIAGMQLDLKRLTPDPEFMAPLTAEDDADLQSRRE